MDFLAKFELKTVPENQQILLKDFAQAILSTRQVPSTGTNTHNLHTAGTTTPRVDIDFANFKQRLLPSH